MDDGEKRRAREAEEDAPVVGKRRNLGRVVDAGDEELVLRAPSEGDTEVTGPYDHTGEDTDDLVVLNLDSVATRPVAAATPADEDDEYSDVEIISSRHTPEIIASVETTTTATTAAEIPQHSRRRDLLDPDVSVELVEDWFGPDETTEESANGGNTHTHLDGSATEDSDDDLVMLDGKPTLSTDQLLDQIKEKDGGSATTGPAATSAKTFQDVTCVICMDPIKDAVAAACGHVFCAGCIYRALASSREPGHGGTGPGGRRGKCPMCRKVVAYKNLVWLKVRYTKQQPDRVQ